VKARGWLRRVAGKMRPETSARGRDRPDIMASEIARFFSVRAPGGSAGSGDHGGFA